MRPLAIFLIMLLVSVQYQLWFGKNSLSDFSTVSEQVKRQDADNVELEKRNQIIALEIKDLRTGFQGVESVARQELGMIKKGETFYRLLPKENN